MATDSGVGARAPIEPLLEKLARAIVVKVLAANTAYQAERAVIADLEAYLRSGPAQKDAPAWQPIETAPKDWTHILMWAPGTRVTEGYYSVAANRFLCSHGDALWEFTPTHWRPMPDSPGAQKDAPAHEQNFAEYTVCRLCGRTEAAINGCHHCNDADSIKAGRCWWCLQIRFGAQKDPPEPGHYAAKCGCEYKTDGHGRIVDQLQCPYHSRWPSRKTDEAE